MATTALLASSSNAKRPDGALTRARRDQVEDEADGRERDHQPNEPARRGRPGGENEPGSRHHNRNHCGDKRGLRKGGNA